MKGLSPSLLLKHPLAVAAVEWVLLDVLYALFNIDARLPSPTIPMAFSLYMASTYTTVNSWYLRVTLGILVPVCEWGSLCLVTYIPLM